MGNVPSQEEGVVETPGIESSTRQPSIPADDSHQEIVGRPFEPVSVARPGGNATIILTWHGTTLLHACIYTCI